MKLKPGGANKLQEYDEETGEYIDIDKLSKDEINALCEKDKENLVMQYYFGLVDICSPIRFPTKEIHDQEYCEIYISYIKNRLKDCIVPQPKIKYLLTFSVVSDKSKFLKRIGYNTENSIRDLMSDITLNTNFKTLKFVRYYPDGKLGCTATTILNNYKVNTIWAIDKNNKAQLVTLIPGGKQ